MFKTKYCRTTRLQTKTNCLLAINDLRETIRLEEESHALMIASLNSRIDECQTSIRSIDAEFEDDRIESH